MDVALTIRRYVPRIVFHPDCQVYPCTLEHLLQGATVTHNDATVMVDPEPNALLDWSGSHGDWLSANITTVCASKWDNNAPAYVQYSQWDSRLIISYTLLYPSVGPRTMIIEIVGNPTRIYLGHTAHDNHLGTGTWVPWEEVIKTSDGRPTVWVGKNNWDFYPRGDNTVWLKNMVPHDYTHDGKVLYPVPRLLDTDGLDGVPVVRWDVCRYRGQWDGVPSPWTQSWIGDTDQLQHHSWWGVDNDWYLGYLAAIVAMLVLIIISAMLYHLEPRTPGEVFATTVRAHRGSGI